MTQTYSRDYMKLGDLDHQVQPFNEQTQPSLSTQNQGPYYPRESHHVNFQQEENNFASEGGSSNDHDLKLCLWKNDNGQGNGISSHNRHQNIPPKWLPSKLRFVRMMMGSDQKDTEESTNSQIKVDEYHSQSSSPTTENRSNGSSSTPVRVCSDCNTTKTPLWRSGPQGPKSLCNACGIRQRKARRALAAAAAVASGTTSTVEGTTTTKPKVQQRKERKFKANTEIVPCKKRPRVSNKNVSEQKSCFEDFLISLSKNLAFHQVFPQDEKEAAILLMALSCNLVHGLN